MPVGDICSKVRSTFHQHILQERFEAGEDMQETNEFEELPSYTFKTRLAVTLAFVKNNSSSKEIVYKRDKYWNERNETVARKTM